MRSKVPGIQVIEWCILNRFKNESWAIEKLDVLYRIKKTQTWAKATGNHDYDTKFKIHKDSNGTIM